MFPDKHRHRLLHSAFKKLQKQLNILTKMERKRALRSVRLKLFYWKIQIVSVLTTRVREPLV